MTAIRVENAALADSPAQVSAELAAFELYVRQEMPGVNELNRTGRGRWTDFLDPLQRHMSALQGCRLRGPQAVLAHVLVNFATRSLVRWGLAQSGLQSHQVLAAVPSLVPLLTRLNRQRRMPQRDQCFQTEVLDNVWLYRRGLTRAILTFTHLPGEPLFIQTVATCNEHAKRARADLLPILGGEFDPTSAEALMRLRTAAHRMSAVWTAFQDLIAQLPVAVFQELRPYNADAVSLRPGSRSFGGGSGADDPYFLTLDRMVFAPLPAWYEERYLPARLASLSVADRSRYEADSQLPSLLELAMCHQHDREFAARVVRFVRRYNAAMGVHWRSVVRYLLDPPGAVDRGTAQVLIETVKGLLDLRRGDPRLEELTAELERHRGKEVARPT